MCVVSSASFCFRALCGLYAQAVPELLAVLFDFGGVMTSSPFENFARYEREHGLPTDFIRGVNTANPDTNAWARLERSDIDAATFDLEFAAEAEAMGHRVPGADVLKCLRTEMRPRMVRAVEIIHEQWKTAVLTNNFLKGDSSGVHFSPDVMAHFDAIVESAVVGIRKPEPEFYRIACRELGVEPAECMFLDDLGINLKPARAMGMTTIKVTNELSALEDLSAGLGIDLVAGTASVTG